jgi:hypothetical protein
LAEWRPAHGGARLLLTSRRPGWEESLGVAALPLDPLLREESVALLKEFRPDLEDGIADKIAGELGDLPLALHLAGSYLKRYSAAVTPVAYLSELRGEGEHGGSPLHSSLAGDWLNVSSTDHEMHVGRTFAISYDRLDHEDEVDALALALLARSACFAPGESIPWELLSATLDDADDDDDAPVGSRRVLTLQRIDGLTRLAELGLVEVMAGRGGVHAPVGGRICERRGRGRRGPRSGGEGNFRRGSAGESGWRPPTAAGLATPPALRDRQCTRKNY